MSQEIYNTRTMLDKKELKSNLRVNSEIRKQTKVEQLDILILLFMNNYKGSINGYRICGKEAKRF